MFVLFIFVCVVGYVNMQSVSEGHCVASKPSVVKLTLSTRRNVTGQWITQVHLTNANSVVASADSDSWDVEVQQSTRVCEGHEDLEIIATLTSCITALVISDPRKMNYTMKYKHNIYITCPSPKPGPGYELVPDFGYYKLHTAVKTWTEARQTCVSEGAHLAVINSEQEDNVLRQLFDEHPKIEGATFQDYVFIGFHDRFTEGQYLTIFGTSINTTGFTRWSATVQPDNAGGSPNNPGEDCGSMHRNGGLNDITCNSRLGFICERELW